MTPDAPTYTVHYKGQAHVLSLRLCEDGYLSGFQRAATELILKGFVRGGSLLSDPETADRFFPLALNLGEMKRTPWVSWLELDIDLLEEIMRDFFVDTRRRIEHLPNSSAAMKLKPALDLISANATWLSTTTSTRAADCETSTGPGTTAADSPS